MQQAHSLQWLSILLITGTIFENTNKPLRVGFRVIHLMLTSKKRMSAIQITRVMGFGSHRTARDMSRKIRAALIRAVEKLGGIVALELLVRFPEAPPTDNPQ